MFSRYVSVVAAISILANAPAAGQTVENGVTEWTNLDQVHWGSTPGRMALLVGNATYSDSASSSGGATHGLDNLANPCGDARLVASSLVAAGWRPGEIALACNQTADQLSRAILHLTEAMPRTEDPRQLTFVYLSGHGAQIAQQNYLFGVKASPDFDQAIDDVLHQSDGQLFGGAAVNVISAFQNQIGNSSRSSILLVLDACRDDPLFEDVRGRLMDKMRAVPGRSEASIAAEAAGFLSAPKEISGPGGMKILYANSLGKRVKDDNGINGHGRLAVALDHAIRQFAMANRVVSAAAKEVRQDTSLLQAEDRQFPDGPGNFLNDPCLGPCPAGMAARRPKHPVGAADGPTFRFASWSPNGGGQTSAGDGAQTTSVQLLRSDTVDPRKITLEVFWCAGRSQSDGLRQQAFALAAGTAARARAGGQGFSDIARVRLTPLTPGDNGRSDRQINDDVVVLDPTARKNGDVIAALDPDLKLQEVRSAGPRYISAYYCRGGYDGPTSSTIYVQAPPGAGLDPAMEIIKGLRADLPELNTVSTVDTRPPAFPKRTEVRYYDPSRAGTANDVAADIRKRVGVDARPKYMPELAKSGSWKQLEVWLSVADVAKANEFLRRSLGTD